MDLCWEVLLTQGCSCYCCAGPAQHRGLFCPSLCPQQRGAGGHREGTQPGQLTAADPRNIAAQTVPCSAIKREGMLAEGTLLSVTFFRDKTASGSWSFTSLLFLGFYFSLFAVFTAASLLLLLLLLQLLNHSYLNPGIFSLSPFQFTSLILLEQRSQEVPVWWVLSCWLRLNHDTAISDSSIFFFSLTQKTSNLHWRKPVHCY